MKTKEMQVKSWSTIKDEVYGEQGTVRRDQLERKLEAAKARLSSKSLKEPDTEEQKD